MTDAVGNDDLRPEDALAWFDSEQRNIAGLVARLEGRGEAAGESLERLVSAVSDFYIVRGMWQEWRRLLDAAITSAERRGDAPRQANLRNALGSAFQRLNDQEQARSEIEKALRIAEESNATEVVPAALASLATVEKHDRRPDRAVPLLQRAVALYRELENRRGEAQALGDLANNLDDLGRPEEALDLHRRAIDLFRQLGDRYSEMKELGNIAIALLNLERWSEAEAVLREVIENSREFGADRDRAAALRDLALALAEQDRFDEARVAIAEALKLVTELESPYEEGLVMRQEARVLSRMGSTSEAAAALRRMAEHFEHARLPGPAANARADLGLFLLDQGDYSTAARELNQAIELTPAPDDLAVLRAQLGLGAIALNEARPQDAVDHASAAVEGFRQQQRLSDLREALRLKGTALYQLGHLREAEEIATEMEELDRQEREQPS